MISFSNHNVAFRKHFQEIPKRTGTHNNRRRGNKPGEFLKNDNEIWNPRPISLLNVAHEIFSVCFPINENLFFLNDS